MRRLAAAAMVLLAACSSGGGKSAPSTATAHLSTTTPSTEPTTTTSLVLARACRARDLRPSLSGEVGAALGHDFWSVRLTNVSHTACSLSEYPTSVTARDQHGVALSDYGKGGYGDNPPPANLPPGWSGELEFENSAVCIESETEPPRREFHDFRVGMPGGGTLSLGAFELDGTCYLNVYKLGARLVLAPPCVASSLRVGTISQDGASQHRLIYVPLRNTARSPCSLSGFPTSVTAVDQDGRALRDVEQGAYQPDPPTGNVEPGGTGTLIIDTRTACFDAAGNEVDRPERVFRNFRVGMPGGGSVSLGDFTLDGRCGVAVSRLGVNI